MRVLVNGRMVATVLAVNLSMGGMLLAAGPSAPVGSTLEVALPGAEAESIKGTVVRSDAGGIAIQFAQALEAGTFQSLTAAQDPGWIGSAVLAYKQYFQASQSQQDADYQRLLGIDRAQFKRIFYATFFSCATLAVLSAWAFRGLVSAYSNPVKIGLAFAYAGVWLMAIQPTLDLAVIRFFCRRSATA
jgi:hypothetical protein